MILIIFVTFQRWKVTKDRRDRGDGISIRSPKRSTASHPASPTRLSTVRQLTNARGAFAKRIGVGTYKRVRFGAVVLRLANSLALCDRVLLCGFEAGEARRIKMYLACPGLGEAQINPANMRLSPEYHTRALNARLSLALFALYQPAPPCAAPANWRKSPNFPSADADGIANDAVPAPICFPSSQIRRRRGRNPKASPPPQTPP